MALKWSDQKSPESIWNQYVDFTQKSSVPAYPMAFQRLSNGLWPRWPGTHTGKSCSTTKMSAPIEKTKEGGDKKKEDDAELDALLDSEICFEDLSLWTVWHEWLGGFILFLHYIDKYCFSQKLAWILLKLSISIWSKTLSRVLFGCGVHMVC